MNETYKIYMLSTNLILKSGIFSQRSLGNTRYVVLNL